MSSQSLYRKWRSQNFDEIIGQDHVVHTLRNAIRLDRIAHAYLFTGPRGTGKTSMARILAKAVNCLNVDDGGPCGVCQICGSIAQGRSPDVIEIDGASNNSIDDVRVLRERVAFAPVEGRFKVYIVDEVHRLSAAAFDGLLKTLEEPPSHVLFVFASTEPHKVPVTILSRCQRFDFHRIGREPAMGRLQEVARQEGLTLDGLASKLIVQMSGGSLRDALGILDQVRAFAGQTIGPDDIRASVGIGQPSVVARLTDAILDGDPGGALRQIHEAVSNGADPRIISRQLIDYWRALLLHVGGAGSEVDVDPVLEETAPAHAARLGLEPVLGVLRALTEQVIEPRLSVDPQLPLEIGVVQSVLVLRGRSDQPQTTSSLPDRDVRRSAHDAALSARPPAVSASSGESLKSKRRGPRPAHRTVTEAPRDGEAPLDTRKLGTPVEQSAALRTGSATGDDATSSSALLSKWPDVMEAVRARSRKLHSLLKDGRVIAYEDEEVTLGFGYSFHCEQVDQPGNRSIVAEVLREVTGAELRVRCSLLGAEDQGSTSVDDTEAFLDEAERMLRGIHARELRNTHSLT